jgi:inosose dehydratase
MKMGYTTWGMPAMAIDESLEHLASLGFDGVEIAVVKGFTTELDTLGAAQRQRIRSLLDRHGLELTAIGGHASLLSKDADGHAENWRRLTAAVDLCLELAGPEGPPVLDSVLGSSPETWGRDDDFVLQRLGEFVEHCEARQVVLALEPHVGDGLCERPEKIVEIVEQVGSPSLKLNFDISHFEVVGVPTADSVRLLAPHTAHTHVKDQRGRVPDFEFLIPGEGPFDFVDYLRKMDAAGYTGYVTAEVSMAVHRRPDYDPVAGAALCFETLDAAFRATGLRG